MLSYILVWLSEVMLQVEPFRSVDIDYWDVENGTSEGKRLSAMLTEA